jgi:hypothetical protein
VPLPEDPLFRLARIRSAARTGAALRRAFPVASRAAYEEAIWLPHWLFLGGADDVDDLVAAFAKVHAQSKQLAARLRAGELV